jgi:hypothetical protein
MENTPGHLLIAKERRKHWRKHGKTITVDRDTNKNRQLRAAAISLVLDTNFIQEPPKGWDPKWWKKMIRKPLKERLIIAGSLLAAEFDRLYLHK